LTPVEEDGRTSVSFSRFPGACGQVGRCLEEILGKPALPFFSARTTCTRRWSVTRSIRKSERTRRERDLVELDAPASRTQKHWGPLEQKKGPENSSQTARPRPSVVSGTVKPSPEADKKYAIARFQGFIDSLLSERTVCNARTPLRRTVFYRRVERRRSNLSFEGGHGPLFAETKDGSVPARTMKRVTDGGGGCVCQHAHSMG